MWQTTRIAILILLECQKSLNVKIALCDNGVKSALNQAWEESNPNAPLVPYGQLGSLKLEQGGWIVSDLGKFKVIRVGHGTRDSLPTIVGTKPQGMVLGWFHTHPDTSTEGYSPTFPSSDDVSFTRNVRVTGLVIHHKGIIVKPYK